MSAVIIRRGSRILVLASLGIASFAPIASAKVVWNEPVLLAGPGRDGFCRSAPLDRAERLAWRQSLMVLRPGYPFVPSLVAPFGLAFVPYVQTGWFWPNAPLGVFTSFCGH
jgi:hypothetical protein